MRDWNALLTDAEKAAIAEVQTDFNAIVEEAIAKIVKDADLHRIGSLISKIAQLAPTDRTQITAAIEAAIAKNPPKG